MPSSTFPRTSILCPVSEINAVNCLVTFAERVREYEFVLDNLIF